jgi:hypothetical protein
MKIYKSIMAGSVLCLNTILCLGQAGIITTNRAAPRGIVSFAQTVTTVTASNTKFIDGYVKKNGITRFVYPVGDNGNFKPFAASGDGTIGAYFMENPNAAALPAGGPFAVSSKDPGVGTVSSTEFWDIDGTNTSRISLSWNQASNISALTGNQISNLIIVGWNAALSRWDKIPSKVDATSLFGSASTLSSGSITTDLSIAPDTYNVYTLAALPSAPLPVTLLSFDALLDQENSVLLTWTTTLETNSDHFNIEYSLDAKKWLDKGSISAQGESSQLTHYQFTDKKTAYGENFYRLKMIDKDGTFAYSRIQSIRVAGKVETAFYPNPVSDKLFVNINNVSDIKRVRLHTILGKEVYSAASIPSSGIDVRGLTSGTYLVSIIMADGTSYAKKIVVTR